MNCMNLMSVPRVSEETVGSMSESERWRRRLTFLVSRPTCCTWTHHKDDSWLYCCTKYHVCLSCRSIRRFTVNSVNCEVDTQDLSGLLLLSSTLQFCLYFLLLLLFSAPSFLSLSSLTTLSLSLLLLCSWSRSHSVDPAWGNRVTVAHTCRKLISCWRSAGIAALHS